MPDGNIFRIRNNTAAIKSENKVGAPTQPCLTPDPTLKASVKFPLAATITDMSSWRSFRMLMNFIGQPKRARMSHNNSLFTLSKAFVKSMKPMYSGCRCSWHFSCSCLIANIISVVPREGRKPHCVSGRMFSARGVRRVFRILIRIFPAMDRSVIPL